MGVMAASGMPVSIALHQHTLSEEEERGEREGVDRASLATAEFLQRENSSFWEFITGVGIIRWPMMTVFTLQVELSK